MIGRYHTRPVGIRDPGYLASIPEACDKFFATVYGGGQLYCNRQRGHDGDCGVYKKAAPHCKHTVRRGKLCAHCRAQL